MDLLHPGIVERVIGARAVREPPVGADRRDTGAEERGEDRGHHRAGRGAGHGGQAKVMRGGGTPGFASGTPPRVDRLPSPAAHPPPLQPPAPKKPKTTAVSGPA